jgi:hypothetical protein
VLVGGTLQPIEETRERLFPWLPSNQLHFFSCGHIVPPESIMPIAVSRGPSGRSFDFSYSSRSSADMVSMSLLSCIIHIAKRLFKRKTEHTLIFYITRETKIILTVNTKFGLIVLHCRKEMPQCMKLFICIKNENYVF